MATSRATNGRHGRPCKKKTDKRTTNQEKKRCTILTDTHTHTVVRQAREKAENKVGRSREKGKMIKSKRKNRLQRNNNSVIKAILAMLASQQQTNKPNGKTTYKIRACVCVCALVGDCVCACVCAWVNMFVVVLGFCEYCDEVKKNENTLRRR